MRAGDTLGIFSLSAWPSRASSSAWRPEVARGLGPPIFSIRCSKFPASSPPEFPVSFAPLVMRGCAGRWSPEEGGHDQGGDRSSHLIYLLSPQNTSGEADSCPSEPSPAVPPLPPRRATQLPALSSQPQQPRGRHGTLGRRAGPARGAAAALGLRRVQVCSWVCGTCGCARERPGRARPGALYAPTHGGGPGMKMECKNGSPHPPVTPWPHPPHPRAQEPAGRGHRWRARGPRPAGGAGHRRREVAVLSGATQARPAHHAPIPHSNGPAG
jgi:hypothetical protein